MFYNSSREHMCAAQKGEGLPVILGNPQSPPPLKNVFWVNVPTLGFRRADCCARRLFKNSSAESEKFHILTKRV